jgi:transposase InsO family protein
VPQYITPYSPEQSGMIERFMRTLKEECIWLHSFEIFTEAKRIIEDWIKLLRHRITSQKTKASIRLRKSLGGFAIKTF